MPLAFLVGAVVARVEFEDAVIREPRMLGADIVAKMISLLALGGEVEVVGLDQRLRRTDLIVLRWSGDRLLAMAAIKRPTLDYKNGVFRRAGMPLPPKSLVLELGYVVVDLEFRGNGIGPEIVSFTAGLIADPLFATSRSGSVQTTLLTLGFNAVGEPYKTDPEKKPLRLFVRG